MPWRCRISTSSGLDRQDRRYLETLIRVFRGGPTGAGALAATMSVALDTLEEEVEPFLLRCEFIVRTPQGRKATHLAYRHLGLAEPDPDLGGDYNSFGQRRLFE